MDEPASSEYWTWADYSHREIVEGRARGNRRSLWLRARLQTYLYKLGNFAQMHSIPVLMIGLLILIGCSILLQKAKLETNVETLWMEVGGHLEKELAYSKEFGSDYTSYEVIIQSPNTYGTNVLTASALLEHVEVIKKAMEVKVDVFGQTWSIEDICVKPTVPEFSDHYTNKILDLLLPCIVITPLDCFWDGAKIYTRNYSLFSRTIRWADLDPPEFVEWLQEKIGSSIFNMDKMNSMLDAGGISHGYMNRPCLDPTESGCPLSAPNKASKEAPDIGKELTGGCKGFAEKIMNWPENIIVGGVRKTKDNVITSAEALQTVFNLMDEKNLHSYWYESDGFLKSKVQHLVDWNVDKAKTILNAWQRKFVKVINALPNKKENKQNFMAFSTTTFNDLLNDFSTPNQGLIIGGYVLMLVYACFTMIRWNSMVQSQGCMGVLGVLLVSLSVAAGLGVCSALGIKFNAASTQVLPFLALGLGVDDMFLLSHTFRDLNNKSLKSKEHAGYCLSTTGVSIMMTSFTNAIAFFMAAIIPIPALRALCLKAGVIILFNFLSIVTIYPAMIALDVRRRESERYDIFCCVQRDSHSRVIQMRPGTISYDNSLVTLNQTSDEDSSLHQISTATANANVSMAQSSTDEFVLPGVALKASANCNFNESICNGMFGGDIIGLPGVGNFVVSVSSGSGQNSNDGESSQNANANIKANVSNKTRGSTLNINASSCASSSSGLKTDKMEHGNKGKGHSLRGSQLGNTQNVYPTKEKRTTGSYNNEPENARKNRSNNKGEFAQSSVNLNTGTARCGQGRNVGPQIGNLNVSANAAVVHNRAQGEPSCSSNAEVVMRPGEARSEGAQGRARRNRTRSNVVKYVTRFSVGHLTRKYYAPYLQKFQVKILVLLVSAIIFSVSIYGCTQVKDGMDMTDVVPKGTRTADFLVARNKYFSFFDIAIITKADYDYPSGQERLYRLHEEFLRVRTIVKTEGNSLPKFWLMYFRDWLLGLQAAFDSDWENGTITYDGVSPNASMKGELAYRLLLHTDNPKTTKVKQKIRSNRLVDEHGIIHMRGFYFFLRAWKIMDPMAYEMSQVHIKPEIEYWQTKQELETITPAAKRITYARMPLYISGLRDTEDYVETIKQVRAICDKYNNEGLPNYPRGVPFTFWEQYIWLRKQLLITVSIVLVTSFVIISAMLFNIWAGFIVVAVLTMTTVELYGFLGLAGIKLSAIPAVTLIFSIGIGVEFTVHLCMVFVAAVGDRNQRLQQALETVLSPVVDGAISTVLGIIMLAGSEFDFVVKYFFHVLAALIVIGFLNGVVFLPVVLSLIGPNPEVVPIRDLATPASTRSWLGLMTFDRNACSSVSNLTCEPAAGGTAHDSSTDADDVNLQIMPSAEKCSHADPRLKTWRRNVSPKQYYGKNHPTTTSDNKASKHPAPRPSERIMKHAAGVPIRNSPSVAKLTATATVTVELQHQDVNVLNAPRRTNESDLQVVDYEEEFV